MPEWYTGSMRAAIVPLVALVLLGVQALILHTFGQPWMSASGHIRLWVGEVFSADNSQQLTDWYTFSHIIHGFLFYWALRYLFPRVPVPARLLMAMGVEIGWELLENSPIIIERYRETALAAGYFGDSILNSVSDTCAMMIGFLLAWRMPAALLISFALLFELVAGFMIRDNLTLNVINLIHPFPALQVWQQGI